MLRLMWRLIGHDLRHRRVRLLLMALAVFGALTTYVLFGAILGDVAAQAMQLWRTDNPYDLVVSGEVSGLLASVGHSRGVVRVDSIRSATAIVENEETSLLTLEGSSLFSLDFVQGGAPQSAEEVAIPAAWAERWGKRVGEEIAVLPLVAGAEGSSLRISGLLSDRSHVPTQPLLSGEGMQQVAPQAETQLLVALDGKVSLDSVRRDLLALAAGIRVASMDDQYAGVQAGSSLGDLLLSSMRFLVLIIAAASMGVLIHLTQRELAYQSGVLRAMGLRQFWLVATPLVQGLLVFLVGGVLSYLATLLWARSAGISRSAVADLFWGQAGLFIGLGLVLVAVSGISFARKPVTELLRDVWGR